MLLHFYTVCIILLLCEAATKIGLGNGRPSEEPSSLKTEVLKFKTSECGGDSLEEPANHKKKQKNRQKNSDDDDDDDDSEEDKRNKRKNRGRNRGRGFREEYMVYGRSYEDNRQIGMNRRDDYNNRQDNPFQQRWDDPYYNRNQYSPYYGNNDDEFFSQANNRRYNNRETDRDSFNQRPGSYNTNNNRDRYNYHEDDRYNNNRDDRHSNRRKHNKNNEWGDVENDNHDYNNNRKGGRRENNRNENKRGNKRRNKDDNTEGECVSQCVFNNMQIMEDDGIPSEAGMIKWARDKIKNEKLKQSAVKEIRKCFGNLASSDGENSCNFSKSLANCLKLGLDDEED